jgi:hypothetical protein
MYASQAGNSRGGVLSSAQDFFALLNNGVRGGERRFFTYTLAADSLRCSETGAAFFTDMLSKHAMHAGGAEEVLFAGGHVCWGRGLVGAVLLLLSKTLLRDL